MATFGTKNVHRLTVQLEVFRFFRFSTFSKNEEFFFSIILLHKWPLLEPKMFIVQRLKLTFTYFEFFSNEVVPVKGPMEIRKYLKKIDFSL